MKLVHYVLIAQQLTGDSEILFFPTPTQAMDKYRELTDPLLSICLTKNLEDEDVFDYNYNDGGQPHTSRFNSGHDEDLDNLLGENDTYYEVTTLQIPDDATHYVCLFSEYDDESSVVFFNKADAIKNYNNMVDNDIEVADDVTAYGIKRYDQSTWEQEGTQTLFSETHKEGYTEAFFGYDDVYWTHRIGSINNTDNVTQDDLRSAKPNTFIFSSVPKQIFVALDPTPFDVSDFGTGKSIILGVFTSLDKANETVLDALKQLEDYDEDEMTPDQYIETHILL